jgi:hypothetical protein
MDRILFRVFSAESKTGSDESVRDSEWETRELYKQATKVYDILYYWCIINRLDIARSSVGKQRQTD